jgi:SPX domain protein involved in polyphosphate accumulation
MDKTTLKRFEKKYMIDKNQIDDLMGLIGKYIKPDEFDRYTICNIYYDTGNYELIRRSIEKPAYKEKLRLRSYGTPGAADNVFFEIKKKYKKEVFKRRISMSAADFQNYSKYGVAPEASEQVLSEIEYFMSVYNPQPKIYIAYERSAFTGTRDDGLRITFDENIRFRNDDLTLEDGDSGQVILDNNKCIMEIKTLGSMPIWLSHALNELNIFPHSFSKYGHCFQNYILNNNGSAFNFAS